MLSPDSLTILADMCAGDFGRAVDLAKEYGLRADNSARGFAFGGANPRRLVQRFTFDAALAAREIDDRHRVAECRVAGKGAAATGLGIVGMGPDADDFQVRCGRLARSGCEWQGGDGCQSGLL